MVPEKIPLLGMYPELAVAYHTNATHMCSKGIQRHRLKGTAFIYGWFFLEIKKRYLVLSFTNWTVNLEVLRGAI